MWSATLASIIISVDMIIYLRCAEVTAYKKHAIALTQCSEYIRNESSPSCPWHVWSQIIPTFRWHANAVKPHRSMIRENKHIFVGILSLMCEPRRMSWSQKMLQWAMALGTDRLKYAYRYSGMRHCELTATFPCVYVRWSSKFAHFPTSYNGL